MSEAVSVRPWRARARRWGRRLVQAAVVAFIVVTLASFGFNALTRGHAAPPPGQLYVQAGDVRTRYRVWGTGGSPIVLVHGAFENADMWEPLAGALARTHMVYALDATGNGYSERRPPYDAAHMGAQLVAFIDALHLVRPVVAGHSSGAAIVAEAALRDPRGVGGVAFLDGDALLTGAGQRNPLPYLLLDPYRTSALRLALRSDGLVRSAYAAICGPRCARLDDAGVDRWRRPFMVEGAEKALWQMLRAGVVGLPTERVAALRALPMRKLVVYGADDPVFTKASPYETAALIGAPSPTLIPDARHLAVISDPVPIAAALDALAR
ncbi:alpha/beta fold hydrolase [Actinomadura parmotrematis]|uniref:Alpha/beta hydrolase n=1 Tax=Actinomadura parmotrematis TaxID=2864039 RepID=A0ABS7G0G3_9ACTN|nr:alpha/beta hydrolase [Actinomadura parmotrematis]MBW8486202.1 alpha/beta hydrolase [Actinomadura parmotrematis]